jgi:uncharacterized protein (TIGR03084 family)
MDEILAALTEQHDELSQVLRLLDDAQWAKPSRCAGWTVADVVLHLAQTDELALASLRGALTEDTGLRQTREAPADVDMWADGVVARERGAPPDELWHRWQAASGAMRDAFAHADPHERVVWVAGLLSARTLSTTRLAECWIHTGDVAWAVGLEVVPTDRLRHIARLAWRTLPYAYARAGRRPTGPVSLELTGPGAETWTFEPDERPLTVVRGPALDFCLLAARRVEASDTTLMAEGPDAAGVLELVRTYA